jgi:hypothetical protein
MRRLLAFLTLALGAGAAAADPVEDALDAALTAWRDGDAARALEELDYARALMGERRAEGLAALLPAALPGWTREDADSGMGAAAAMFGGGAGAAATYRRGSDAVTVEVMADSPMVAALGAVLANPALAGMQGALRRKGRQSYIVDPAGDVSALIEGRTLLRVTGGAPAEDKLAYFEAVDLERLGRD